MSSSAKKTYLGDYVDFQNGYAFKSSDYTDKGHYLIRIKNVQQGFIEINDECFVNIPSDDKFEKFKLKNGDIVVSLTGNVGRIARIKDVHLPAVLNQRVASVAPKSEKVLSPEYLYYLLRTPEFLEFAIGSGKGAAQQNISTSDMEKYQVSIPSLEKQAEIVEKLDSAFNELDLLEGNFINLISLNDSLLSAKINSELSAMWRSPETKTLGQFGKINYGYTAKSSSAQKGSKYLRITDIQNRSVKWSEVPSCEISTEEKRKYLLSKGDIVFARTGATTGKSYLIVDDVDAVFASYLIRIKPDTEKLNPDFLYYFFQSSYYWDEIVEGISGSAQGGFNASKLQAMKVSFPSDLEVQNEIVKRIREIEVELDLRKKKLLEEASIGRALRQSLLSNAFSLEEAVA
jgi:type I restriction enzyme S subunit